MTDVSQSAKTCDTVNGSSCVLRSPVNDGRRIEDTEFSASTQEVKSSEYLPKSQLKNDVSAKTFTGETYQEVTTQINNHKVDGSQPVEKPMTGNSMALNAVNDSKLSDTSSENELDNLISDVRESQFGIAGSNNGSKLNCDNLENSDMELLNICNEENFSGRKPHPANNNENSEINLSAVGSEQTDLFELSDRCESEHNYSSVSSDLVGDPITLHLPSDLDVSSDDVSLPESSLPFATKTNDFDSPSRNCWQSDECVGDDKLKSAVLTDGCTVICPKSSEGSDHRTRDKSHDTSMKISLEVQDSKQGSAATSLTDSQLFAVFDNSDFPNLENTVATMSSNNTGGRSSLNEAQKSVRHNNQANLSCGLSPGCIAAMDVTFSPYVKQRHSSSTAQTSIFSTRLSVGKVSTPKELRNIHPSIPSMKEHKASDCEEVKVRHYSGQKLNSKHLPIKIDSALAVADNSLEDLFECTSGLLNQSSLSEHGKSAKISTLADRTFKIKSDAASQGSHFTIDGIDERLSLVSTTQTSCDSPPSLWNKNFEFPEATSPMRQCYQLKEDDLILSSQKDLKNFPKTRRTNKTKARKIIMNDADNLTERSIVTDKDSIIPIDTTAGLDKCDSSLGHDILTDATDCRSTDTMQSSSTSSQDINSQIGMNIIDVCSHLELFNTFLQEWSTKKIFSLAVATRKETVGWCFDSWL